MLNSFKKLMILLYNSHISHHIVNYKDMEFTTTVTRYLWMLPRYSHCIVAHVLLQLSKIQDGSTGQKLSNEMISTQYRTS